MNPWVNLPLEPPYVLAEDKPILDTPKFKEAKYRLDAFPDPFVGSLEAAKVVFLSLNPGFEPDDINVNLQKPFFILESRRNILHQSHVPFLYLADEMADTFGYRWWSNLFAKSVRDEPLDMNIVRQRIMIIEYMPYHSETYKPSRTILSSQRYNFELVRKAINMGKKIVIMRNVRDWIKAVPELEDYGYIRLNSQRPYISRGNMTKYNSSQSVDELFSLLKTDS